MELALLFVYSYLVGSIPTAYIIGRLVKGIDIREYGSGNVGGSNVFQHVGRRWLIPLGLFEVFVKGASPVWLGIALLDVQVGGPSGVWTANFLMGFDRSTPALAIASLLSIVGHNWPIFLKFQGGRGIGTAAGGLFAMAFYQLWIFIAVGLPGYFIRRSAVMVLVSAPPSALDSLAGPIRSRNLVLLWYDWNNSPQAADGQREAPGSRLFDDQGVVQPVGERPGRGRPGRVG